VFAEQIKGKYLIVNNYALCALSTLSAQHKAMRYHRLFTVEAQVQSQGDHVEFAVEKWH
jgi:hypothetical protein